MTDLKPGSLNGLVDVERGIVTREIFVSEEIYRQELERVFARAWLFLGHESQIPRTGDYVVSSMGEESVIVCRDAAARVRVFLNSCRHRGMKVCRYDGGNAVEFMCPYHGWSYGTDGALVGVPFGKQAYGEQLDRSRWGLIEVPQVTVYKGAVGWWGAAVSRLPRRLQALPGSAARRLGRTRGRHRGARWHPQVADALQLEVPRGELLGRPLSRREPPLGRHGGHRPERPGPPGHVGAPAVALARRDVSRAGPFDDRVPAPARRSARIRLSGRAGRRRVLPALRGGAPATPRARVAALRRAGHGVSERLAARAPAAHDRRVAPARAAPDGGMAVVPGRRRRAVRGEELPAPVLHALLRAGGAHRAGRHG